MTPLECETATRSEAPVEAATTSLLSCNDP